MANLAGYNRLKYGVSNKPKWESQYPITKDSRSPAQKEADRREKAIRTCANKIKIRAPHLTDKQCYEQAVKWYDSKKDKVDE